MPGQNKIAHPLNGRFYHFFRGRRFDPGVQAEVLEQKYQNPILLATGSATIAGSLRVTETPQVWFNKQTGIVGLGGNRAGSVTLQPLFDPTQ